MLSKQGKQGTKIWTVSFSETALIWKVQIHTGRELRQDKSTTKGQSSTSTDTEPRTPGHGVTDYSRTSLGLA